MAVTSTSTDNKEVISALNDLIQTNKDGEEGFRTAAEKAKDSSLKSLFSKYSSQRASNVTELQGLVSQLGGKPADSSHLSASLHRGWINLKEALARDEDKAIINECEAGEDAAVKNYNQVLAKALPAEIASIVQRQFSGVQEAHNVIRDMKHSLQSAAKA